MHFFRNHAAQFNSEIKTQTMHFVSSGPNVWQTVTSVAPQQNVSNLDVNFLRNPSPSYSLPERQPIYLPSNSEISPTQITPKAPLKFAPQPQNVMDIDSFREFPPPCYPELEAHTVWPILYGPYNSSTNFWRSHEITIVNTTQNVDNQNIAAF
jgi:hypothetical protein